MCAKPPALVRIGKTATFSTAPQECVPGIVSVPMAVGILAQRTLGISLSGHSEHGWVGWWRSSRHARLALQAMKLESVN